MLPTVIFWVVAAILYSLPIITIIMMIRAQENADHDVPEVPTHELWLKAVLWPITLVQVILALKRGGFPTLPKSPNNKSDDDF